MSTATAPLGTLLRDWRQRRRMSQLDLALDRFTPTTAGQLWIAVQAAAVASFAALQWVGLRRA